MLTNMLRRVSFNGSFTERRKSDQSSLDFPDATLPISNYNFYESIGEGAYCKVRIVQSQRSRKYYALKYMPKSQPANKLKTLTQERNVLSQLQHPFLCNLRFAFQDAQFFYMLVDLMHGGDLRHYLKNYTLTEDAIRVIMAELGCAIDYLHENGIVHRDVKPENILLDCQGHVHLADFNVAYKLSCDRPVVKGVSGTFSYMAPEMQEGGAYTELVDWWALGVVFYECVYGRVPFKVKDRDRPQMLRLMSRGAVFPSTAYAVSDACVRAIRRFLELFPYERIRNCNSMFQLDFFKGMDREDLESQCSEHMLPVFIPPVTRFNLYEKLDRKKAMAQDLANWKTKNERGGKKKASRKKKMGNKHDDNVIKRYKTKIRRYSHAFNRYLSTKAGWSDSRSDSNKSSDFRLKFGFQSFNCEGMNNDAKSPSVVVEKLSSSPASDATKTSRSLPKRNSLMISLALNNPTRKSPKPILTYPSQPRKLRALTFKSSTASLEHDDSYGLPAGVLAYGPAAKGCRATVQ